MVCMFIGLIFNVIPYFLLYQMIKPLILGESLELTGVLWRVAAVFLCGILYAVLYIKGLDLSHQSAYHTLKNLRISLQGKLEKQPLGVIQEKGVGTLKKLFVEDIESIELLLAHALPEGFANWLVPVLIFVAMFFIDWKLALLSLCALPLGILSMSAMYKAGTSKMGAYYGAAQKMNNTIVEYINGMEVVKVFNRDGESYKRFETDVNNYRDFTLAWYKVCWPWMALYGSIFPTVCLFSLPIGAFLILQGYSTLPDYLLILCMSFGVGAPMMRGMSFLATMPQINYKIQALETALNAPPLKQSSRPFQGKGMDIDYDNVCFSYGETEVLHNVSFHIPENSLTALVGESGSGKSTLAKLLVHFYDINSGSIRLGGQDISDMSIESLNDKIAYVSQEQFLYNITLQENIRIGKLDATDEEVMAAAEKAQCKEFLDRLPNGILSSAGDSGKQLSGGERQRISLARAILKDAPIIVLDEATAFMDPDNEEKMNNAIAEVIKGKTVIVIAHRLHSIINADQICVLDNGNLVACDKHEKLLENCEQYKKLWSAAESSIQWKVSTGIDGKGDE